MKKPAITLSTSLMLLLTAPLFAHHSFDTLFDRSKSIELNGTVSKLEWVNPHVSLQLDVKDAGGKVTQWNCVFGSPNLVVAHGLSKEALSIGETITVNGAPARDGSNNANAITVKLPNNPKLFQASSAINN